GGTLELIQLWINLPAKYKMTPAKYQDIKSENMPYVQQTDGISIKLVSGTYKGLTGPAKTFTPIISMMGQINAAEKTMLELPENYSTLLYVLGGEVTINSKTVSSFNLINFEKGGKEITIEALKDTSFLVLSGEPISEPMVQHGPFVMNTAQEINEAIQDYHLGKMGHLAD
ncbi:MAG: pirin family protein, partial [Bacteroidetes bacterium]|nr:pirin family protein [Bacteroidota bacterium]